MDGRYMQGSLPKRSQQKGQPRKVIDLSIRQDVTLHHTENPWKGRYTKAEEPTDADQSKTKVLLGKIKSILNKLTPQKFRVLVDQLSSMEIDTEERLRGAVDLIFEQAIGEHNFMCQHLIHAISQPNFSVVYASMCQHLIHIKVPRQDEPDLTLRQLLLSRCQKEFQKYKADKVDFGRLQNEIDKAETEDQKKIFLAQKEEAEYKAKKRSLGNIRFIGELFKHKMLTENIMYTCIQTLLSSNDDEDNLECLCRLLTTIGKELDHTKAKPRIDQYFDRMRKIVRTKKTSTRVRFILRDVIDLRENNWVPRREDNNPKTIEQIHREAQQEERQKQMMIQNAVVEPPPKRNVGRGRGPRNGGPPPGFEEGWQSVGKASARNQIDPFRMKITKQTVDENIQLGADGGPGGRGGFMTWARGSSRGTTGASRLQESEGRPVVNRHLAVAQASGSWNQSREPNRNKDVARECVGPLPKERIEKDVKQRTKGLIDEYLHVGDLKKLEFTIGPEQPRSPGGLGLSIISIHRKLDELIVQKNLSNEEVFDWIEANVSQSQTKEPRFIRALITAVCESTITGQGSSSHVNQAVLKGRCLLLKKYLDHKANLELQAVYAIQAMVHKLGHPPGVLMTFFESLYDEEVISEDAFNQWDQSNDPAEQAGKGVARTTVGHFFRWLREAEKESQEDS